MTAAKHMVRPPSDDLPVLTGQDLCHALRPATQQLAPIVVAPCHSNLRLHSYLDKLEGPPHNAVLKLTPIAADVVRSPQIHDREVRIHYERAAASWVLTAPSITAHEPYGALVPLRDARLHRLHDPHLESARQPAHTALVLAVPGGLAQLSAHVFPVMEIGEQSCVIEASEALPPQTELPRVELVGERRVLRTASARIENITPWRMSDGSPRFQCGIKLMPPTSETANEGYDLIADPDQARRLVCAAASVMAPAWLRGADDRYVRATLFDTDTAALVLEADSPIATLAERSPLSIGFEYASVHYQTNVRLLAQNQREMHVTFPLTLRRRFRHRRTDRIPIRPEHSITLHVRHPALGRMVSTTSITDLSFTGIAFLYDPTQDPLWEGLPLEAASLDWQGRKANLGELEVMAIQPSSTAGMALCRARTVRDELAEDPVLIDLLATVGHPDVQVHPGDDFDQMIDLYRRAGLFAPHMDRNLDGVLDTAQDVWRRLHSDARGMMRTVVHPSHERPDGAVTVVRAWEHAWLYQHFVCIRPAIRGAAGRLQSAILDHVLPRPDGHYIVFFVKADNRVMNAFYERFFAAAGTAESIERRTYQLWVHRPDAGSDTPQAHTSSATHVCIRAMTEHDEALAARAAERSLGSMAAAAFSYQPGEFSLPDTKQRMGAVGVARARNAYVVECDGLVTHTLIEECAPPGFNLTWMLNAWWILPVHVEGTAANQGLEGTLQYILERPPQSPTGDRFVVTAPGIDTQTFSAHGFEQIAPVYGYVLNRAGLHRYFQYTAGRYSSLRSRTEGRRRQR